MLTIQQTGKCPLLLINATGGSEHKRRQNKGNVIKNPLTKPSFEYIYIYQCAVWDPYQQNNKHSLEMVQRMAARILTKRHNNSSVSSMIQQLDC